MTGWRDVQLDANRKILRGEVSINRQTGAIVISLPFRLPSPNGNVGRQWYTKARERKAWAARLRAALAEHAGQLSIARLAHPLEALGLPPVIGRRRVSIVREVKRVQDFIRDDDNLAFCGKHLIDAVKGVGLIRDDAREWCELVRPTQKVSADKRDRTVITVEIPPGETVPLQVTT